MVNPESKSVLNPLLDCVTEPTKVEEKISKLVDFNLEKLRIPTEPSAESIRHKHTTSPDLRIKRKTNEPSADESPKKKRKLDFSPTKVPGVRARKPSSVDFIADDDVTNHIQGRINIDFFKLISAHI